MLATKADSNDYTDKLKKIIQLTGYSVVFNHFLQYANHSNLVGSNLC